MTINREEIQQVIAILKEVFSELDEYRKRIQFELDSFLSMIIALLTMIIIFLTKILVKKKRICYNTFEQEMEGRL